MVLPTTPQQKLALARRAKLVYRLLLPYTVEEIRDAAPQVLAGPGIEFLGYLRAGQHFNNLSHEIRDAAPEAWASLSRLWGMLLTDLDPTEEYFEGGLRKTARVGGRPRTDWAEWMACLNEYRAVRPALRDAFPYPSAAFKRQPNRWGTGEERGSWNRYRQSMKR